MIFGIMMKMLVGKVDFCLFFGYLVASDIGM